MDTQDSNQANASDKLEEVQNELHCSICHDYFVQASTLSCSHSFCFNCINAWRQTHTDCPVCRREILGMAPSRALDNMVAALVDRTNSEAAVQASLQQFGAWITPAVATEQTNNQISSTNPAQASQHLDDSDLDSQDDEEEYDDWEDDDDEEESYSVGSYDAEEEEYEGEEEEDEEEGEEEEDVDDEESYNSDDDEEFSDDDDYNEHAKRSNQNNPNNDEYWISRGWSGRPDNWKELVDRQ